MKFVATINKKIDDSVVGRFFKFEVRLPVYFSAA